VSVRRRDKAHLKYVAAQACLICGRQPSDPHHLRFAQATALGRKVSDEFTVPLCRSHHRDLHRSGREQQWWDRLGIDPLSVAAQLWSETHNPGIAPVEASGDAAGVAASYQAVMTNRRLKRRTGGNSTASAAVQPVSAITTVAHDIAKAD
jgi:hypothetical protein